MKLKFGSKIRLFPSRVPEFLGWCPDGARFLVTYKNDKIVRMIGFDHRTGGEIQIVLPEHRKAIVPGWKGKVK